ncbi:hypothetical protein KFK09_024656 [Dendrobium nobile]|uniref:Pentatricopeptide repeat-containing protein n=1 Tax=Dendrobium nobile TaxID=94219 RepID=A0A8T3AEE3_DENNO|nr:hypothetical protein KFK09_024656 [Dendrobium nobile]
MDILAPTKTFPSLVDYNFRFKVPHNSNATHFTTSSFPKRSSRSKLSSPSTPTPSTLSNGHPSLSSANLSGNAAGNDVLRRLVRNGELDSALRLLESIFLRGTDPPDIIPCTSLIRGLCRSGRTAAARRVLDIIETSGASPDVITYNVMISGYCKSGETDEALNLLHRMSVPPDVVTYNTIFQSLCERGKARQSLRGARPYAPPSLRSRCLHLHHLN